MEQLSQSGSRGRRPTGNEPAPHERVKGERRANEPRRTVSPIVLLPTTRARHTPRRGANACSPQIPLHPCP